jgi:hypothetical protein
VLYLAAGFQCLLLLLLYNYNMNLYLVGRERCVVCSEFEADGLHGCHLSFDHMLGPTGIAVCLPYPVAIAAIYLFCSYFNKTPLHRSMWSDP